MINIALKEAHVSPICVRDARPSGDHLTTKTQKCCDCSQCHGAQTQTLAESG